MASPFIGTWILNVSKSQFDANHRPTGGSMRFELDPEDNLLMTRRGYCRKRRKGHRASADVRARRDHSSSGRLSWAQLGLPQPE